MLFSVLPMAVEADMLLAVRITPENSTIKIANVLPKYPPHSFVVGSEDIEIDGTKLEWSNYFKAGYRGAIEFLRRNGVAAASQPPGMEILVDGSVPSGGGLSSSAAFVCASALAAMVSMGVATVDKKELVSLAIVSERYVGVNSGGMDQSASVLGQKGSALYISFDPELLAEAVAFPKQPEMVFLIANTFRTVEKQLTGPIHYNLRVVETTLAAEVLAKKLQLGPLPQDAGPLGTSLKGLMDLYFSKNPSTQSLEQRLEEIAQIAEGVLYKKEGYTREEIAAILGLPVETLTQKWMTRFPVRADKFQLQARALHVFKEAARVVKMHRVLAESTREEKPSEEVLVRLGELMNESQKSCKELYDCSCEDLDELCRLAREAGSYGSRLTGAGWGGCSVHMVPKEKVDAVKKAWIDQYYSKLGLDMDLFPEAIVETKPGSGAVLYKM
jgi:galactokinase